ncbi:hypothetical protein DCCM_4273 [Desulfocucumis palustris]|uniref:Uncharacterized protein n=1 Tax=Desulfocucumis palustris TaxID=1898651 RepID=A0A2L2XG82_9FIRM|nr:hypothetical protein DCCM_4273 [Desulfocucumis palustris]
MNCNEYAINKAFIYASRGARRILAPDFKKQFNINRRGEKL